MKELSWGFLDDFLCSAALIRSALRFQKRCASFSASLNSRSSQTLLRQPIETFSRRAVLPNSRHDLAYILPSLRRTHFASSFLVFSRLYRPLVGQTFDPTSREGDFFMSARRRRSKTLPTDSIFAAPVRLQTFFPSSTLFFSVRTSLGVFTFLGLPRAAQVVCG